MGNFADNLLKKIEEKKSVICLGLDPHYDLIPDSIKKNKDPHDAIEDFFKKILNHCHKYVACVKPNYAFFEEFGWQGIKALENVSAYAKKLDLMVIVDGKRNDIGSTAAASARAFLSRDIYDALTVNPYLGQDGILPFVDLCRENKKGIFILVKTSNPSSGEFQDLITSEMMLYENVAHAVARWGMEDVGESGFSSIGAVVGATYPEDIRLLRKDMSAQIFLIPGYGAQGGGADEIKDAFFKGAKGAIVNSSRGILFASREDDFAEKAQEAAIKAKEDFSDLFEN